MRRLSILIGAAVAVIALILVFAFVRFDVSSYRAQIQTEMEQRLGREVALGNLQLKLIPPRLRVESLVISEDPAFQKQTPFLKADTVDLSVRLLPLLAKRVEVDAIDLHRPHVEMVKNAKGVWNFSSLGGDGHPLSSDSAARVRMEGNLTLHDGQVAVTSLERRQSRRVYDHIDMKLRGFAPEEPFSIDAVARISSRGGQKISLQGTVGPLSEIAADRTPFDGTLKLDNVALDGLRNFLDAPVLARTDGIVSGETKIKTKDGKLMAVGGASLENLRVNGLVLGYPVKAHYDLAMDPVTDVITIVSSTISLGATPVDVSGSVNLQPTPVELDLKVVSQGASVGAVTRLASALGIAFAPDTTVTGHMNADVQVRGPANNPALNGQVSAQDLRVSGKDVPQPVQVGSVDLALTPKAIRSNTFEIRSGNTKASARFGLSQYTAKSPTIDFALRASNANLPEILAMARAYGIKGLSGINGSGSLNLDIQASGPVRSIRASEIMQLLDGNATMNFNNVRIAGLDVEQQLASLGGFKKPGAGRGGTDIQHLTGHLVMANGVVRTNDLRAVLNVGNVGAAGTANLGNHALHLRATAILTKEVSREVGGGGIGEALMPMLTNSHGELVIPGLITGTFENPKFEPDMDQLGLMRLKGIVPTSDNPFGVLGTLFGHDKKDETKRPSEKPSKGIDKFFDKFTGGKN